MANKKIKKTNECSVQTTTLENFVDNVIPALYIAPDNQRIHKAKNADQFLAFLIYWAIKAETFKKTAAALPGCTIVHAGLKPIMISISVRNGQIYIQDGQHRYYWSKAIFANAVKVSSSTGNIEVDNVVKPYVGLVFDSLPDWLKKGIREALVVLEVVDTNDVEMEKVLFDDKNRGSSVKTSESLNNNFCNVPIYQQMKKAVEEIMGDESLVSFNNKYPMGANYLNNSLKNEDTLFHLITRCMTVDTFTNNAKAIDIEAMSTNCTLSQSQAHALVQQIIDDLCLGASMVGPKRAVNTYAGACVYVTKNRVLARRANSKKYRVDMHDAVWSFENRPHPIKSSVVNGEFLSSTTHDKGRVRYAVTKIDEIVSKVVI